MSLKKKTRRLGKRGDVGPSIEFGRVYRDDITGFVGRCTGYSSYIAGCDQVLIVPTLDKDGKPREGKWFDDARMIDVELEEQVQRESKRGGPQHTPPVGS